MASSIKLRVPSAVRFVDAVHAFSERIAETAGIGEDAATDVGTAVREAVINAMTHGNGLDPKVPVEIVFDLLRRAVRIRVRDRGRGFDPAATPDPTEGDNRLRTSGRGLLMVRAFVDEVAFDYREGRGMEVTLTKRVQSGVS